MKGKQHRYDDHQEQKDEAKASKLFPDELIDQLLAQVRNKDDESILGESGLAGQLAKYQRRLPGFDDHVISMCAHGMSVREIQAHLLELYGLQVSPI
jgi:hypothetical protein